jgi:hypothetical protein
MFECTDAGEMAEFICQGRSKVRLGGGDNVESQ